MNNLFGSILIHSMKFTSILTTY